MGTTARAVCPVLIVLACWPGSAAADWLRELDLSLAYDDNINRAADVDNERGDRMLDAEAGFIRPFDLREWGTLDAGIVVSGRAHDRFGDLNRATLGVTLDFRRRLGLGRQAPWIAAHAAYYVDNVRDDTRDAQRQELGLSAGRAFGDAWQVAAGIRYGRQSPRSPRGSEGNSPDRVFRLETIGLNLDVDYLFNNGWLLLAGVDLRDGDINASTTDPELFESDPPPWVPDQVFGPGFRTYRLDATSVGVHAGVSLPLGRRSSLNLQARHTEVDAENDISYGATRWQLSYLLEL